MHNSCRHLRKIIGFTNLDHNVQYNGEDEYPGGKATISCGGVAGDGWDYRPADYSSRG